MRLADPARANAAIQEAADAAVRAGEEIGIQVVPDRCMMVDKRRLLAEG